MVGRPFLAAWSCFTHLFPVSGSIVTTAAKRELNGKPFHHFSQKCFTRVDLRQIYELVGDPACDLIVTWNLLAGESRDIFRAAMDVDEVTWARGRGWALYKGLVAQPYYLDKNPVIVCSSRGIISEVLADFRQDGMY